MEDDDEVQGEEMSGRAEYALELDTLIDEAERARSGNFKHLQDRHESWSKFRDSITALESHYERDGYKLRSDSRQVMLMPECQDLLICAEAVYSGGYLYRPAAPGFVERQHRQSGAAFDLATPAAAMEIAKFIGERVAAQDSRKLREEEKKEKEEEDLS